MIWTYEDRLDKAFPASALDGHLVATRECVFCRSGLRSLGRLGEHELSKPGWLEVQVCDICGWWSVERRWSVIANRDGPAPLELTHTGYSCGSLRNLDLTDVTLPMEELRTYLAARYQDRHLVPPERFEEVVGSVFHDFGYSVCVTARSGDRGIDVLVLCGDSGDIVGVQVKRYKSAIEPEQIRAFAGALILNKLTQGIFVTTSRFSRGAGDTAHQFGALGIPITLLDADRFYDALKLGARPCYKDINDPTAPVRRFVDNPDDVSWRGYDRAFI